MEKRIEDYIEYDETSSTCLRWKKRPRYSTIKEGDEAGSLKKSNRYFDVGFDRREISCHRIVYYLHYGVWSNEEMVVNHIDNNPLNNRIDNLELITARENLIHQNRRPSRNSKTGVRGVNPFRDRFAVYYKGKYVGYAKTLEEGKKKYLEAVENNKKINIESVYEE